MKKIIHLSDLHFGRVDRRRVEPLLRLIDDINPDIVVVSGDFTQRAKESEFIEAKKFLESLKRPFFVVPGNHDVPLYNLFRRFYKPFKRYRAHISDDLAPIVANDHVAIIGLNSVRSFAISSGRINKKQIAEVEEKICNLKSKVKIVVCHHPFDLPVAKKTHHKHTHKVVGRSKMAVSRLAKHGVDVFLSGHLHLRHVGDTTLRYKIKNYAALIVQAGTAISTRRRGEPVSFNVLHVKDKKIDIDTYIGDNHTVDFSLEGTETFVYTEEKGWAKEKSVV